MHDLANRLTPFIENMETADPQCIPELVTAILKVAREANASDIHLRPTLHAMQMRWRIDGVLSDVYEFDKTIGPNLVARLKVLAELLTYRTEVPQEGRIRQKDASLETRVATFPTVHGEKAVIRLFAAAGEYKNLSDLGFSDVVLSRFKQLLHETSGVILLTGPAGSGKTTTIYAALREIIEESEGKRSLVSLEDPIEVLIGGVDQSHAKPDTGFNMATGLRSLMRQDPDVIMVGEIRDRETAETVFQASLTGHLVLTTFHAGSACQTLSRLSDMGIEPYLLRSGLLAVFGQRLLRRLCECKTTIGDLSQYPFPLKDACTTNGCEKCSGTGYRGRLMISEMLEPNSSKIGAAILRGADAHELEQAAISAGMFGLWDAAISIIENESTSPEEVIRVLGLRNRT